MVILFSMVYGNVWYSSIHISFTRSKPFLNINLRKCLYRYESLVISEIVWGYIPRICEFQTYIIITLNARAPIGNARMILPTSYKYRNTLTQENVKSNLVPFQRRYHATHQSKYCIFFQVPFLGGGDNIYILF